MRIPATPFLLPVPFLLAAPFVVLAALAPPGPAASAVIGAADRPPLRTGKDASPLAQSEIVPAAAGTDPADVACIGNPTRACILAEAGQVAREAGFSGFAVRPLVLLLARQGRLADGLALAGGIDIPEERAWALSVMAGAAARAGLLTEALTTASSITDARVKSLALDSIVKAQVNAGFFAEALTTTRGIEDASDSAEAMARIAEAQADPALFAEALATARGLDDTFTRALALASIAGKLPR